MRSVRQSRYSGCLSFLSAFALNIAMTACGLFETSTTTKSDLTVNVSANSEAADKIVFATRIHGRMVYAIAGVHLALKVIWVGSNETISCPGVRRLTDKDLTEALKEKSKLPAESLEVKRWDLLADTLPDSHAKNSAKHFTEGSTAFTKESGLISSIDSRILPFSKAWTYERPALNSLCNRLRFSIEPEVRQVRPLYLPFRDGYLDLWLVDKDPSPHKEKLYLPEDWLPALEQLAPTGSHPLGGIRIHSNSANQLGITLDLLCPNVSLLSSLRPRNQIYITQEILTLQNAGVMDVSLFSQGTANKAPFYEGFHQVAHQPSWHQDGVCVPICKDSRKGLSDKIVRRLLNPKTESIKIKGVRLNLKHDLQTGRVIASAESPAEAFKAFSAEILELRKFYDGCNTGQGSIEDGFFLTDMGCFWDDGVRRSVSATYVVKREPRLFVQLDWVQELKFSGGVLPPYRIWP